MVKQESMAHKSISTVSNLSGYTFQTLLTSQREGGNLHMSGYGDVPLFWVLFWGLLPDFWVPVWAIPGFWVSVFGYSRIFGYHFLVKFDFFQNSPDFGLLILIFPSMTLWNVSCRALVSMIPQFSLLFLIMFVQRVPCCL